jgi:hypothetical protein
MCRRFVRSFFSEWTSRHHVSNDIRCMFWTFSRANVLVGTHLQIFILGISISSTKCKLISIIVHIWKKRFTDNDSCTANGFLCFLYHLQIIKLWKYMCVCVCMYVYMCVHQQFKLDETGTTYGYICSTREPSNYKKCMIFLPIRCWKWLKIYIWKTKWIIYFLIQKFSYFSTKSLVCFHYKYIADSVWWN